MVPCHDFPVVLAGHLYDLTGGYKPSVYGGRRCKSALGPSGAGLATVKVRRDMYRLCIGPIFLAKTQTFGWVTTPSASSCRADVGGEGAVFHCLCCATLRRTL